MTIFCSLNPPVSLYHSIIFLSEKRICPRFNFALSAIWSIGEIKTVSIKLDIKSLVGKWDSERIQDRANQYEYSENLLTRMLHPSKDVKQILKTLFLFSIQNKKRILRRCIHHFWSDVINNMDNMRISGTEPSSVILSQTMKVKKLKSDDLKVPKQAEAKGMV